MPDQLDPNRPLPPWQPRPGSERDPERIDVLLQQIERIWKDNPTMRLGQLLVNLLDPQPNRLFDLEDHTVSQRIFEFYETGRWPSGRAEPPEWVLSGERPPSEVRRQLRPIFDDITRKRSVENEDVDNIVDTILGHDQSEEPDPPQ